MEEQREECRPKNKAKSKIDIKSLDEQLQKHLDRVVELEKKKKNEQENYKVMERVGATEIQEIQEWEIDPEKLIIKGAPFARGTFASVHKGVYNDQTIAVKVLDWGEEGERPKAFQRDFQREVSVWYELEHPNVTKCIGATTMITSNLKQQSNNKKLSSNSACVITEYLSGGTLKSYLIKFRERKLPMEDVLQLALDLARGLSYLHSKNIVHRDVKTENLLLDNNRMVKIADFGVARLQALNLSEMTGNTGTPGYMAPEVLESKPYDKKCDVYSFGICLWEISCCQMPYSNYSFSELTSAVVYKNLRPQIPKSCPSSLAKVMKRCWDAEPSKRPEMEEVVTMLENIDNSKHPHGCFCFSMLDG
ncbi:serine/threonine-protein kinase STY13-like [Argentina anserina]|uniref:serine/threonine-protein kinase STY13-like n=1 Tax=Argentina anserina TaxID=57926 RepID=UPI0021767C2E|nr:serine/threonine-protein kinase STY13-like [Potentilla anserina]